MGYGNNSRQTAVHETAYPRLKSNVTRRELVDLYTPTEAEVELAGRVSKGPPLLDFIEDVSAAWLLHCAQ
jgi:hypothetical protein